MIDARNHALEEAATLLDGMADLYVAYRSRELNAAHASSPAGPHLQRADLFERDCITLRDAAQRVRELKKVGA